MNITAYRGTLSVGTYIAKIPQKFAPSKHITSVATSPNCSQGIVTLIPIGYIVIDSMDIPNGTDWVHFSFDYYI